MFGPSQVRSHSYSLLQFCAIVTVCFFPPYAYVFAEKESVFPQEPQDTQDTALGSLAVTSNETDSMAPNTIGGLGAGFFHGFLASLSVIIISELGDKTFFIAAIMAMKHSRLTVFSGAMLALTFMTILSALLGYSTTVIPRVYTYYASAALFALFGIKMLKEGISMSSNEGQEEFEEVQSDLRKKEEECIDLEGGGGPLRPSQKLLSFVSRILLQAFTLTFLAEWGDRSQLATIILAARDNVWGVTVGGVCGHALCTALAVIGGRIIAQRISVKTVTIVGGFVFLGFAVSTLFIPPD
ncbi:unnamed protein product [Darwinula stevensoni]|uniref:GDT1 family protein n=1 Tax=Darwinula stevensoni TaxID=69355 RepID=A0A7R9A7L8_9CRUS|nr:unnamed protein product [Darwinula stevensoni]CAG0893975.1 unnamed protein product [Darwinula stevensoni]